MKDEPILFSLAHFREIILAAFDLARVKCFVEIGSQYGSSTEQLCDYAKRVGGRLITIDPAPQDSARVLIAAHTGQPHFRFIESTSLEALPTLNGVDAYIVDGDHNYYTVRHELEAIAKVYGDRPWLVFAHDVCWPWGRRDLYYAPERIPGEFRHPFRTNVGVTPESSEPVSGGFGDVPGLAIAVPEGGPHNGVRTAIEDFLAGRSDLRLDVIPAIFGLGVIYSRNAPWSRQLSEWLYPYANSPLLERLEQNRVWLSVQLLHHYRLLEARKETPGPNGRVECRTVASTADQTVAPVNYQSHIGQDAWVAECLQFKRGGYFLDFGAFDGKTISNTYALEKHLGWQGICVEPNPRYYQSVCESRNCVTVNVALWPKSRELLRFCDTHSLSSLEAFKDSDANADRGDQATLEVIEVDTLNPTELLKRFKAPQFIDYLTLDVEGAEYDVLRGLDLNAYSIALMTIEHNHDAPRQERIRAYLAPFGYEVVQNRNDDFFFHRKHLARLLGKEERDVDPTAAFQRVFDRYVIGEAGKEEQTINPVGPAPEVLPGRHPLGLFRTPGHAAYDALWSVRLERMVCEQDSRFLPPVTGTEPFKVGGFCVVCGGNKEFTSDFIFARPDAQGQLQPAWRERQVCTCGLNCRQRSSYHLLTQAFGLSAQSVVYCTEQTSELFRRVRGVFPRAIGSEYLGGGVPLGTVNQEGIRNEDITRLTFADASLDCIFSLDVMEHVPDYKAGFREMARCLKPGGRLLLTAPFDYYLEKTGDKTVTRASLNPDGTVTHHLPPLYHGDPLNSQGVLCFHDFGWDLLDNVRAAGFPDATLFVFSAPQYGYIGQQYMIFATRLEAKANEAVPQFRLQGSSADVQPKKPAARQEPALPASPDELRRQVGLLCQAGKWDAAEPHFRNLTRIHPDRLDGWKGRVECSRNQNHGVMADLIVEEVLEHHPEWTAALAETAREPQLCASPASRV